MTTQALQDFVFASRYARYDPALRRNETWEDAVARVERMHLGRYPGVATDIAWAFNQVRLRRALGAQRALQFGGAPILRRHAHIYNCAGSYCDRLRFFQEAFWLLLCGVGVGLSVQKHHVARLPAFRPDARVPGASSIHAVVDSPEGWADALGALLSSFFEEPVFPEYAGCDVRFDYSRLSPAGTPLPDGLGPAPEPALLERALEQVRGLLVCCLAQGQARLRPIDAYDVLTHMAGAVLAGGTRRGAAICVFSVDDEEMLRAKTGNWFHDHPHRARSNNSCLLLRDRTTRDQFDHVLGMVREFGEPGFLWADSTEYMVNCCSEVGFWPVDESTGASGWALSTLTEINGGAVHSEEDFARAARAAALIGTWQAGYTDLPYLGPVSERIVRRESLIGVSITGMMENAGLLFDPAVQRRMAELVKAVNAEAAEKIGIPPAARTTCVKPSGSASCLLGTSSGIHPHHAHRYFRRIRASRREPAVRRFAARNPQAVEPNRSSANPDDVVLTFCIEAVPGARTRAEFGAVEFLALVRGTQQNWVLAGGRPERGARPWLHNNVSNTVTVRPGEWEEVGAYLYEHRADFTGVALLAESGDQDYPQAPMCAVPTAEQLAERYGDAAGPAADLVASALDLFDGDLWSACAAVVHGAPAEEAAVAHWVRQARELARSHLGGDLHCLCRCLQDVHNERLWRDLSASYTDVDYTGVADDHEIAFFARESE